MKKKIISMIVLVMMFVCSVLSMGISAYADYLPTGIYGHYKYEKQYDGTVKIIYYNGSEKDLIIPDEINGMPVSIIGDRVFSGKTFTNLVIPDSVTTIESEAFEYCKELKTAQLGKGVTTIDTRAFYECSNLESINIPNGVKSIGNNAFANCTWLQSISVPDSVESIGDSAFSYCKALRTAVLGEGISQINRWTFNNCINLKIITIPDSVQSIEQGAFHSCQAMTSVNIGKGVEAIYSEAFLDCRSLKSVVIPQNVYRIDQGFGYRDSDDGFCFEVKMEDFYIYCYSGTEGQNYAYNNNFSYTLIDGMEPTIPTESSVVTTSAVNTTTTTVAYGLIYGDANDDGKITAADVLLIRKSIAGQNVSLNRQASDVNVDEKLTASDVLLIRKYIAGQSIHLGK